MFSQASLAPTLLLATFVGGEVPMAAKENLEKFLEYTHFRRMPKNMRNLEESSGGFSGVVVTAAAVDDVSEAVEGAVEVGEGSRDAEATEDAIVEEEEWWKNGSSEGTGMSRVSNCLLERENWGCAKLGMLTGSSEFEV